MNKKIIKIGALALGMFALAAMYTNAQIAEQGTITLTVNTGASICTFDDFVLNDHDMQLDTALTVSGLSTTSTWTCTDGQGGAGTSWSYTIAATPATGSLGGVIPAENIGIRYAAGTHTGDAACVVGTATSDFAAINNAQTIIGRSATGTGSLCAQGIDNVTAQVLIPANQVPGNYQSDITLTAPSFFQITDLS